MLNSSPTCASPSADEPSPLAPGLPPPLPSEESFPSATCDHLHPCPHRLEVISLRQQAHFYRALHQRACQRLDDLQQRFDLLQAENRDLKHRLYGRQSETHHAPDSLTPQDPHTEFSPDSDAAEVAAPPAPPVPRPRGQRRGAKGHGRRDYSQLPTLEEVSALPEDQCHCSRCGQPFAPFPGTDDTTVLEVEVRAYRRVVHRRRYRPTCTCADQPGVLTAPAPPRLIPKSPFGVSLWVHLLLDKYLFYRPTHRLLADWRSHGLDLAAGSLTGGLQQLLPLFEPLYEALVARSQQQTLQHADETRWLVFAQVEGKVGYRWYLWLFPASEVTVFVLAAGRSHEVPPDHLGEDATGILVVDRYKAYQAMEQVKKGQIVLAFCWAHQRRDFVELARSWPTQQPWAQQWLKRVGELYHLNDRRLELREDSEGFEQRDRDLRAAVADMERQAEQELAEPSLHSARRKVLLSLGEHWTGLTVFVEHPEVPMDNNTAERAERGPVVGRKNYYGSGAEWSGRLAAMLFSLFGTVQQWQLNPRTWLTWYLQACASAGGKPPAEVESYLPWNLSEEQRQKLQRPPSADQRKEPPDTS